MIIRPLIARAYWAASRYRLRSQPPPAEGGAVLIGAPHTSNWDFVFMLAICWRHGVAPLWVGKHTLPTPPLGAVLPPSAPLTPTTGGLNTSRIPTHNGRPR